MVRRPSPLRWLPILAAGLACAGCAALSPRRAAPTPSPAAPPEQAPAPQSARAAPEVTPLQIPNAPAPLLSPVRFTGLIEPPAAAPPRIPDPPAPLPLPEPQRLIAVPPVPALARPPRSEAAMPLRELYRLAQRRYATVDGYVVRLKRREQIGGKQGPDEVILLRFRKEPWSVYMRWLGGEAKNREVVYVKDRHGNQIHTLTGAGDTPLKAMGAGKHVQMPPDHPLVLARSRYPITETGVGALIDRYGRVLEAVERGDLRRGTLKYLGQLKRPEFDTPVEAVMQLIPAGAEPGLPRGGQRFWFFDTTSLRFPVLTVTQDERGSEVEYYCYDTFLFPARLRDDDFDPDRLWRH